MFYGGQIDQSYDLYNGFGSLSLELYNTNCILLNIKHLLNVDNTL